MTDFVQLWVYLASTPLFGLNATLVVYLLALAFYTRMGQAPWANPVLWSILALGTGLWATGTAYPTYFAGAQFIHFLLGPAVVALAWPLWVRREVLARHARPLLLAAVIGGAVGSGAAVGMGWLLGLPPSVLLSLAPKAITAPVAMGIAQSIQGIPELAAVFVLTTGLIGAILGSYVFKLIGEHQWPVQGFAFGTQAHGFGTARALQLNAEAGAYAGLALGLQALLGSLLIPLIHTLFR